MRLPLLIFLFVWAVSLKAQVNLVPNPSFESYNQCPYMGAGVSLGFVDYWNGPYGSVDYYNSCAGDTADFGIPISIWGSEETHSGDAYIGIVIFKTTVEFREYAEIKLLDTLIFGKKYVVEFYVSLIDSCQYSISSIGTYFSINGIEGENINQIMNHQPQVENPQGVYLDDKEKWEMVSGSFIAQGGEQFITIGNFRSDAVIDTLFVGGSINIDYRASGYYIDDVSVTLDTTTGIPETEKPKLKIFPNPAGNQITIEQLSVSGNQLSVEVYDALGRLVLQSSINNQTSTIPLNLSKGVYLLRVKDKEEVVFGEKLIIE